MTKCRYELYETTSIESNDGFEQYYSYIAASHCLQSLMEILHDTGSHTVRYLIVDNKTPYPMHYPLLGLSKLPDKEELRNIIFECKLAKYSHFVTNIPDDPDDCSKILDEVMEKAQTETDAFCKRLSASMSDSPDVEY